MTDDFEDDFDGDEPVVVKLKGSDLIAWVSEEDTALLHHEWTLKSAGTVEFPHYYAFRTERHGKIYVEVYLHNEVWERMIEQAVPKDFLIDHRNQDKLDNRRSNLRLATRNDNERNKQKRRTSFGRQPTSRYKGVVKVKGKGGKDKKKPWRAIVTLEKRQISLGYHVTEREAAEAYNRAADYLFAEFACLNVFDDEETE